MILIIKDAIQKICEQYLSGCLIECDKCEIAEQEILEWKNQEVNKKLNELEKEIDKQLSYYANRFDGREALEELKQKIVEMKEDKK